MTGLPPSSKATVVCFVGTQALGNFIMYNLAAASVAAALGGARLGIIYRDDRPYKAPLMAMNPAVSASIAIPADKAAALPLDWFDPHCADAAWPEPWRALGLHRPDVFLTPGMLDIGTSIPPIPGLHIPPAMAVELGEALCRLGLDHGRWFACVHMRQLEYLYRHGADRHRCVDPQSYLPMIRDILFEQGGQVVRLGDPSMTPLPPLPGLIDLSRVANAFPLQAFAASRARYFVGTDTGATQLASAFKTPSASTNALGVGIWNDDDVILPKTMHLSDGRRLTRDDFLSTGMLTIHRLRPTGLQMMDNPPEQLVAVARHMHRVTTDCPGWREAPMFLEYGNQTTIRIPLPLRDIAKETRLTWWSSRDDAHDGGSDNHIVRFPQ